jgi:hypothetical protein
MDSDPCSDCAFAARTMNLASDMIEGVRMPVPKPQLQAIPAAERTSLLLASHAMNELTTLRRLLIFSPRFASPICQPPRAKSPREAPS